MDLSDEESVPFQTLGILPVGRPVRCCKGNGLTANESESDGWACYRPATRSNPPFQDACED
jgi:hypothetical protein